MSLFGIDVSSRYICRLLGGLAQLARALAWHARGRRFDPDTLHSFKAAFGWLFHFYINSPDSFREDRWFDPDTLHSFNTTFEWFCISLNDYLNNQIVQNYSLLTTHYSLTTIPSPYTSHTQFSMIL